MIKIKHYNGWPDQHLHRTSKFHKILWIVQTNLQWTINIALDYNVHDNIKNAKVSLLKKKQLFHVQCFASNARAALKNHLDAVKVI